MARIHVLVAVVFGCYVTSGAPGTTPNIRDIFIGRCLDYQEIGPGRHFDQETKDCDAIWDAFFGAWGFKDASDVIMADYQEFFDLAKQTNIPSNKTLLWSGTYVIAHEYADNGKRYVTLEDTLIGYLANGLTWCGLKCANCSGINYDECPDYKDLPVIARQAFWGGASSTFAGSASGVVKIMVNGSDPTKPAFRPDSFMALFELPDLSSHVSLRVILVHDLDKAPEETCITGSLVEMRKAIESHGFQYFCEENPDDVLHLLCVDNLTDPRCELIRLQSTINRAKGQQLSLLGSVLKIPPTTASRHLIG